MNEDAIADSTTSLHPVVRRPGRLRMARRRWITVLGLSAALGLVGNASRAQGAGATIKVKIGIIPTLSAAPIVLGIRKGFFAAEGLDATVDTVQSAAAAVPALLNGDLQFLESASTPTIAALVNKVPLKVVGNETTMNDAQAALMVAADGPKSMSDLAGKTVAVNALRAFLQLANQAAIDKAGGDSRQVRFVELPFSDMIGALKAGRVDAITVPEPLISIAQAQGLRVLSPVWQALPKQAAAGWQITSAAYAKANPEVVAKFQRALRRSVVHASQQPDEVREIIQTYMKVDPATAKRLTLADYVPDVSVPATEELARIMRRYGYIKGDLPDGWLIQ